MNKLWMHIENNNRATYNISLCEYHKPNVYFSGYEISPYAGSRWRGLWFCAERWGPVGSHINGHPHDEWYVYSKI